MDLKDLQQRIAREDASYALSERAILRQLSHQAGALEQSVDSTQRQAAVGEVAVALLRLCNLRGWALEDLAQAAVNSRPRTGKRIALIGTSASPITNGHLTMGLEILALTDVDMVWYYIVGKHPWGKKLMPAAHRVEMVRRATARYPRLAACDYEVVHGERIYADTMETAEVMERYFIPEHSDHQFSWVMGSDVAQTFHEWGGAAWMAANMRMVVIHRLGYDFDKARSLLADPRHCYLKDDIVTSNISSTLVRQRGREYDQSKVLALVPEVVWDYLVSHQLLHPTILAE